MIIVMGTISTLFQVPGITCGYCKQSIETALRPLRGVTGARVDLAAKTVTVSSDPAFIGWRGLVTAIEDCGYDVAETREVGTA